MELTIRLILYTVVFLPMAAAVAGYLIGRRDKTARSYFADGVTGVTFGLTLYLLGHVMSAAHASGAAVAGTTVIPYVCGRGLSFTLDGFRALYGAVAAFMWCMTTLFSKEYFAHYRNRNRYYLFLLMTLGATEGVFLSADFYTTFIFFEIMSLTSYLWVAHDEKPESMRAAATYLAVAVIGGLVMLMGIFLLYDVTGTLAYDKLINAYGTYGLMSSSGSAAAQIRIAGICLLFGFGAKAGAFPLHIWLPKAHPVAPAPASALLSGILTKAGMYGILILTAYLFLGDAAWGTLILLLGVCTMVVGALLALYSVDLKRTLACSSVSQIGFILVGVGMSGLLRDENLLAVQGTLLHMVNHSLIKLTLFMAAGVIFMNVHRLNLNDIRGFGHGKPLLHYIFLMGALGIGGIPLWNGYVSKTLLHESIVAYGELAGEAMRGGVSYGILSPGMIHAVEWIFLFSGGLTVAYMTKLYVAIFVERNADAAIQAQFDGFNGRYMNKVSAAVLTVSATLLPIMGLAPHAVMERIAVLGQDFLRKPAAAGAVTLAADTLTPEASVSYFAWSSLKGALISIAIGALIYLVIVRLYLMKKGTYVNRWYRYFDLENMVYRPLLLGVLPFVSGVACRVLDSLVDGIVVLLRRTVYRDSKLPQELPEGTAFTHVSACIVSALARLGNKTIFRRRPRETDYEHRFAMLHEEWFENSAMITRSMSFGLLLFCVGLIAMLAYLFIMDIF